MNIISQNATAATMDRPSPSISVEQKLMSAWRRERFFVDLRGTFHVLLWLTILLAVDFGIDWTLNLSGLGRLILLALNLFILAGLGYFYWLRHVKRYDALRTALEVETYYPQFNSLLVSYVQLRQRIDQNSGISPTLVDAMCNQAIGVAAPIDFGAIVSFRALRPLFLACCSIVLAVGWAGLLNRELVAVFFGRLIHPSSTLRYPTNTQLESVTKHAVVQEGRTFAPSALAGGTLPPEARLTIRPLDGEAEIVSVPAAKETQGDGKRAFTYQMGEVYRSFTYTFRIGDAVSDPYVVTVVPPPNVKARVTVTYPPYTNRKPLTKESLTVEVLEGSQIDWSLDFDRVLSSAEMVPDSEQAIPFVLQKGGRAANLTLGGSGEPLTKTLRYSVRLQDGEHGFAYSPPAQYTIQVVTDRAPRVVLESPARDLTATRQKVLDIRATGNDDYGLASAQIVYSVLNQSTTGKGSIPETSLPIKTDALKDQPLDGSLAFKWSLLDSIPDLSPGDVVHYSVALTDNRPDKPSTTWSEMRRISIVTPAEYVDYVAKQRARLLTQIRELQAVEKKAAANLEEELKTLDGQSTPKDD